MSNLSLDNILDYVTAKCPDDTADEVTKKAAALYLARLSHGMVTDPDCVADMSDNEVLDALVEQFGHSSEVLTAKRDIAGAGSLRELLISMGDEDGLKRYIRNL